MAGTGEGQGQGSGVGRLESQIYCIKYTLFCFNIILFMFGATIFALTLWIRLEPGFSEWIEIMELWTFYIGIYILLLCSLVIVIVSFVGCGAALMENTVILVGYIVTQLVGFLIGMVGSAVLLDYSTYDSKIQPMIRDIFTRFMNNPQHEYSRRMLSMLQEQIGCCGADGPNDYMNLRKPLPSECRDTVTGNAFFYGCVEEITWYLEEKSGWLAGVSLAACFILIVNAVMALVLIQAVKKEEDEVSNPYKR